MKLQRLKSQSGFTIIELFVILTVVIILLAIVVATYSGISKRERDIERKNDIELLRSVFDTYYAKYNSYPSLQQANDANFRKTSFKDFDNQKLRDPSNKSKSYELVAKPQPNSYAYSVTTNDAKDCDNKTAATMCTRFTLTATYERGGTFVKSGLN